MAKLDSNPQLAAYLSDNGSFVYAHLIKFERPIKLGGTFLDNGTIAFSDKYTRYAYITDSAYDISFDDNSTYWDRTTNSYEVNPIQRYRANKLLKVSSISESAETKISNLTLTLDATSIDAYLSAQTLTFASQQITATDSFSLAGFREGDLVQLTSSGAVGLNNGKTFRIGNFKSEGKTIAIETVDDTFTAETGKSYSVSLASTELNSLVDIEKSTNFVNRQVFVYKAFFRPDDPSTFIGNPVLIFNGIITSADYKEDINNRAEITWTVRSHWADFQQVRGRLTADEFHRALDSNGNPSHRGVIKPEYVYDKGFQHGNKAIDVLATYTVLESRYKKKTNTSWGMKKVSFKEYKVPVPREVDLRFNFQSKYIPVVYGVRRIDTIPVFIDTSTSNPAEVYAVDALCEGPIQGILNVYVDDSPLICTDESDSLARAKDSGTSDSDVFCYGRADRGDVLGGTLSQTSTTQTLNAVNYGGGIAGDLSQIGAYIDWGAVERAAEFALQNAAAEVYTPTTGTSTTVAGSGLTHEKRFTLEAPISTDIEVKVGYEDQLASAMLVNQANQNSGQGFKLQDDANIAVNNYWGPDHRLLDTAYVAQKTVISEDQTAIPKLEYVVKGRLLPCYNYDYSFSKDPRLTSAAQTIFLLGDNVSIHRTSDDTTLVNSVQIIDKWFFFGDKGTQNYRFRFGLNQDQQRTLMNTQSFYMKKGTDRWYMITHDFNLGTFTPTQKLTRKVSSYSIVSNQIQATLIDSLPSHLVGSTNTEGSLSVDLDAIPNSLSQGESVNYTISSNYKLTVSSGTQVTLLKSGSTSVDSTDLYFNISNKIILPSSASATNDYYKGYVAKISKSLPDGTRYTAYRTITGYDGTNRTLTLYYPLSAEEIPDTNSTIEITLPLEHGDYRPSTNFAIMLLDYMTNKKYGAGLTESQINRDAFLSAARLCDTTSDITVNLPSSSTPALGDVYKYESTTFKWQGTVKSIGNASGGIIPVVFTDCVGKLTNKFNTWATRAVGDVIHDTGNNSLYRITTAGIQTAITTNATQLTANNFTLSRVSGTGPTTIQLGVTAGNPITDYSLYDSDFIKYWKYLGWDSHDQRWVTRHQGNVVINTSEPVLSNIATILNHFNGVIAFEDGKYAVYVETQRDKDYDLWWNFQDSTEGWTFNNITTTMTPYYTVLNSNNVSPTFTKSGLVFNGYDNQIVQIKVKRTSGTGWTGRLSFTTFDSTNFTYYKDLTTTPRLNEWVVLTWNMNEVSGGSSTFWQDNFITGLRFQLGVNASDDFQVEWIAVGSNIRVIEKEDIIGSISIKDDGLDRSFNSLSANIPDPQNNFSNRSVAFFNSDYLAEDRGVVKSTNFDLDGITNYYNARMSVEQTLRRSRYARTISFSMRPVGLGLTPSDLIRVVYPRFGWDKGKYFRVTNLTHTEDCLVNVSAEEYNDIIYNIGPSKRLANITETTNYRAYTTPSAPTSISATGGETQQQGQITLSWTSPTFNGSSAEIEIWRSTTNNFNNAAFLASVPISTTSYIDSGFLDTTSTTYYYWLRTKVTRVELTTSGAQSRVYYSDFADETSGTTITAIGVTGYLTRESVVVAANSDGTGYSLTDTGGTFKIFKGSLEVTSGVTYSIVGSSTISGLTISINSSSGVYTLEGESWSSNSANFTLRAVYDNATIDKVYNITKATAGVDGTGITIVGEVASVTVGTPQDTLTGDDSGFSWYPPSAGDAVIETDTGDLWVYDGTVWNNVGQIQGPPGTDAKFLVIGATGTSFKYNESDTLTSASTLTFTAFTYTSAPTISWKTQKWNSGTSAWVDTATNRMSATTGTSSNLTATSFNAESVDSLRVVAYMATESYTDSVTITKIKDGASSTVYYVAVSSPVITKDAPDATTDGVHSSITIQGKKVVGSTTTNYGWVTVTPNGGTEAATATDTASTPVSLAPANNADKSFYTIKMYNGATRSSATLLDTEVVNIVFKGTSGVDGTSPLTIYYGNDSHTVPIDKNGNETWTGSGGDVVVYEGITPLTLDTTNLGTSYPTTTGRYRLNIVNKSGNNDLTIPAVQKIGDTTARLGNWAGNLTTVTVYTITAYINSATAGNTTRSVDITIAPAFSGQDGDPGSDAQLYYISTSSPVIFKDSPNAATAGTHTTVSIQGKKVVGSTITNYGWVTVTANGATESATATDTASTPRALEPTTTEGKTSYTIKMYDAEDVAAANLLDTEEIPVVFKGATGSSGTSSLVAVYTNDNHSVPVTTTGDETWTGSGGSFYVYNGTTALSLAPNNATPTANNTFNITFAKQSGDTLTLPSVTAGTNVATLGDWAGDLTGVTVYRLTANIKLSTGTFTRFLDVSLIPSTQGVAASVLTLSKTSVVVWSYANGVVQTGEYSKATGQANLFVGETDVTASTTWSVTASDGVTGNITSAGVYSITALTNSIDTGSLTINGVYADKTYTAIFSIAKTRGGYEIVNTLPTEDLFEGRIVYLENSTEGIVAAYTNDRHYIPVSTTGAETWTNSGGNFYVYNGTTALNLSTNNATPTVNNTYNISITKVSGNTLTIPSISGGGTAVATIGSWAGDLTITTVYRITANIKLSTGTITRVVDVTIIPVVATVAGQVPEIYSLSINTPVIYKTAPNASTSGSHTSITIQGKRTINGVITNYGWITITPDGGSEDGTGINTATQSYTFTPTNDAGKSLYTIRMYKAATVSVSNRIDVEDIPIVFTTTNQKLYKYDSLAQRWAPIVTAVDLTGLVNLGAQVEGLLPVENANEALRNASITIDPDTGVLLNIGTPSVVVNNESITVDVNGILQGIGTDSVAVNNSKITVDGNGTLVGIGTAGKIIENAKIEVDVDGILRGIGGDATVVANSSIQVDSSGKLTGIGTNNIVVNNAAVTIDGSGIIQGIGTPNVVINNSKIKTNRNGAISYDGTSDGAVNLAFLEGQVPASKLTANTAVNAINRDPFFTDKAAWYGSAAYGNITAVASDFTIVTPTSFKSGVSALQYSGASSRLVASEDIIIDSSKSYRVSVWVIRTSSASPSIRLFVAMANSTGGAIVASSNTATGWAQLNTHYNFGLAAQTTGTTWTKYEITFGPSGKANATYPSSLPRTIRIGAEVNTGNLSNSTIQFQDFRLEQLSDSQALEKNSVSDVNLVAGAVSTAKLNVKKHFIY